MTTSLKTKILSTLSTGAEVSAKQFAARFGSTVSTVGARISELRREGYTIYNNARTDTKGRTVYKYRFGNPTKALVAAGFMALNS